MSKLERVPLWVWLLLAVIFILSQAIPCLAFDRSESYWNEQPCGFKEVELDKRAVPESIWKGVDQLAKKCQRKNNDGFSTERADGRIFTFTVKHYPVTSSYRVRSVTIRRGGEVIYSDGEKVCQ